MKNGSITPQELAGIHEILYFKNTCAVKSKAFYQIANDERLRLILEQDLAATKQQLKDVQYLLKMTGVMS